ncbi:hypothetical protein COT29_01660 [Candidatus Micrarchaeota archaeon CG08_land_8_20_14_0_20_59_11]|nr:MAG: hypothetical protein COT29_01660 [Candidatus Micrarchaeota archaeon CG08_land_8_20_14_0_20_59_11]
MKEAEAWLVSAKHTLVEAQDDEALSGVCCAQAIHGIIRANDALTLKFFGTKATRHDDVPLTFAKLAREGKIEKSDEAFKNVLSNAVRDKSGADYGKRTFTNEEARRYVEKAEEFIGIARKYAG